MISLKNLILATPIGEEMRKELLEEMDTFSDDKKYEISDVCWSLISSEFLTDLNLKRQKMLIEMAKGEKTYNKDEFSQVEEDLFNELAQKIEAVDNDAKIEELKRKLEQYSDNQNSISEQNISRNNSSNSE